MFNNNKTFTLRIHGYGGQGSKSIANVLAKAAIAEGMYAQAFPEFGPERRGAPVKSFARFSVDPIMTRSQIEKPDFVIFMDTNILKLDASEEGIGSETYFLIQTPLTGGELKKEFPFLPDHHRIQCIDALSLIAEYDNKVHMSVPIVGRFLRITELVPFERVREIMSKEFLKKIGEEKFKLTEKALEEAYYKI